MVCLWVSGTHFSPEFLEVGTVALETRMESGLADSMESWALLWMLSGLVWYTLLSEHEGLQGSAGFLSSGAKRSQPRAWKMEKPWWLLCPAPAHWAMLQRGTWLWAARSLQPACPVISPVP